MRRALAFLVATGMGLAAAQAAPIKIVAAENFYGDIAAQLGGGEVEIASILTNPDQDPHLFEASPSTARAVAGAAIVIVNGADYDPWMARLLSASPATGRTAIEVASLVQRKPGDNPHLWYDPGTMPVLARALTAALIARDPDHRADYEARLARFAASLAPIDDEVARLRRTYQGTPVTATEPIFGYMAAAIGLDMRNLRFQLAVMNGTEPGAREIAAFQTDLRTRAVKALICNLQTSDALSERMKALAGRSGVPVVAVGETEPPGTTYQAWMLSELAALDRALSGGAR